MRSQSVSETRLGALAALAAAVLVLGAAPAAAATFDVSLTGQVANGSFSNFTSGGTHFDQWFLSLDGLDASNAITVSQGDVVNVTVTLDQPFTIPASVQLTSFTTFLFGSAFPAIDTGTDGTTTFFLGAAQGLQGTFGTTTSSQLALGADFFPPNNGAITFDSVTANFTIDNLRQPVTLDGSAISYTLFSPAGTPEPQAWALMLAGFAGLGGALRARRRTAARVA